MTNEELYDAFLEEGSEGVREYYKYEHEFEEDLSDAEKRNAQRRLVDEFKTGLSSNTTLRGEIVDLMLTKITTDQKVTVENVDDYLLGSTQDKQMYSFQHVKYTTEDKKSISKKNVMDFLEDRFSFFQDSNTPKNAKEMIFNELIQKIKKLPGFDYYSGASDKGLRDIKGGLSTDALKLTLSHFTFRGKTITNPDKIPVDIKHKEIAVKELLTTEELLAAQNEIKIFIDEFGYRSNLTPLIEKISKLTEKSGSRINVLEVDEFISKLDLSKYARRERIYAFWHDKKQSERKLKQVAAQFDVACEELLSNPLNDDLKEALTFHKEQYENTFGGETPKFSYIVQFDTDSDIYQKKFGISTIDDNVKMAKRILFDFLKTTRPDAIESWAKKEGLSAQDMEESFDAGKRLRGYETYEEGKKKGQEGEIDYGHQAPDTKAFNDELQEFGSGVADPLFYYIYRNSGDKLFNRVAVFKNQWNKIKNNVHYFGKVGEISMRDDDLGFKDLERHLRRINDEYVQDYTDKSENLYLPLTPKLRALLESTPVMPYQDNDKYIFKYLQALENFLNFGREIDRTRSSTLIEPQQAVVGGAPIMNEFNVAPGVKGRSKDLVEESIEEFTHWAEKFKELLELVVNYYIKPNRSQLLPLDNDAPRWATSNYASFMAFKSEDTIGDFVDSLKLVMALQYEYAYETIDEAPIEALVEALELHSGKELDEDLDDVIAIYENIVGILVEIFASVGDVRREANMEMGAALHENLKRNHIEKKIIFHDRPTSKWAEMYEDAYPKKNDTRERKTRGVAIFPLEAVMTVLQSVEHASIDADAKDTNDLYARFFTALRELPVAKSELELKILETHDIIRKMMNKPVYFNTRKIDNFTHVNGTVDKIEKRYSVNLTPFEIEGIVDDQDSHENISKMYGVPTEVVYYVKGSFR